ncbi:hypothetical protein LPJ73_001660 [Coemansia sp. RSA 2703]|nr:hypothetical protein LPJ73_001660 [Coemansia sp. RSA 2703]KAJ2372045.1 hypothetical protein IW150_004310 [Coemansia sp. RSA 2607]KAJ2396574.1 hypothetical protein GGI05_001053 [Coemansia sp. RSA 2603]
MPAIEKPEIERACSEIVHEGDLHTLTARTVREGIEKRLGLEEKSLGQEPYKSMVKEILNEVLARIDDEQNEKEEDGHKSEEEDEDKDDEAADSDAGIAPENNGGAKSDSGSDKDDHNSEESDIDNDSIDNANENKDRDDEDDFSDVRDEEPVKPKGKKRVNESNFGSESKKAKSDSKRSKQPSSANDTTITNLKSYINKCGLRKVWSKELAEMNQAQQIRHLKKILDDLGMEGRPTLEKCKKIKAKRDLQAELEAIEEAPVIDSADESTSRRRRSAATKNMSYRIEETSDEEEEEQMSEGDGGEIPENDADTQNGDGEEEEQEEEQEDYESEDSDAYTESASDDMNAEAASDEDGDDDAQMVSPTHPDSD